MYTTCCCIYTPDIVPWGINKLKGNDVFGKRVVRAQVEYNYTLFIHTKKILCLS